MRSDSKLRRILFLLGYTAVIIILILVGSGFCKYVITFTPLDHFYFNIQTIFFLEPQLTSYRLTGTKRLCNYSWVCFCNFPNKTPLRSTLTNLNPEVHFGTKPELFDANRIRSITISTLLLLLHSRIKSVKIECVV